ncbi:zinc finger domain-containing protein [Streptomyces jumonjinensis]|uniref:DNA-binding phage zinc finger domain-containing protein n=1 Tax=Streptomyces jumonjinensis TaxID=1945 RepID=A0A646KLE2_STRJU|nr:hypothetical protein [Streptomyces jumonjinensis]MQT03134.1 hypothetical protein [Streptomyces jumonjinensis]
MNADQAAELLAHCSGFDNRQPSVAAAKSWAAALPDVPFDQDTRNAVAAYYTTPPQNPNERLWILPHHVRTLRTKIRNARLENYQYEPPPGDSDPHYLARYRGQVAAVASGRIPAPADRPVLEGGPNARFVRELEARDWTVGQPVDDEPAAAVHVAGPLSIACPVPRCAAAIGHPCKTGRATAKYPMGKPIPRAHPARRRAAAGEPEVSAAQRAAEEDRIREMSRRALERLTSEQQAS